MKGSLSSRGPNVKLSERSAGIYLCIIWMACKITVGSHLELSKIKVGGKYMI